MGMFCITFYDSTITPLQVFLAHLIIIYINWSSRQTTMDVLNSKCAMLGYPTRQLQQHMGEMKFWNKVKKQYGGHNNVGRDWQGLKWTAYLATTFYTVCAKIPKSSIRNRCSSLHLWLNPCYKHPCYKVYLILLPPTVLTEAMEIPTG